MTVYNIIIQPSFHGQRDTLERNIIIGGFLSFSPIVICVVRIYKFGPGIIFDSLKMGVNHCLITSRNIADNI
jgi:hypothetical protein